VALWNLQDPDSTTALGTLAALDPIVSFSCDCDSVPARGGTNKIPTPSPKRGAKSPSPS